MQVKDIDYSKESILVVDDASDLRETLVKLLTVLGFRAASTSNGPDALKMLSEEEYTFLLTDMKMPEMDGIELIKRVRQDFPEASIIAMTGYSEGYKYIDVINAGSSDFINKPFDVEELEAKVRRIINERNLIEELNRLSITDSLTGLYNQRYFYMRLKEEVIRAERQRHSLALILLDLNNFKEYNDTYGHLAGDEILRDAGDIINKSIREGVDSGYRYGGDEFAIILIDADLGIAKVIANRIERSFRENGKVTASIGYARFSDGMSLQDLVARADKSLYKSKPKTKNNAEQP